MSFFLLLREITTRISTMVKRFRFKHILLLLSGMLFFSCQNKNIKEHGTESYISFKDYYGRDKQIKKQPQRIVSLSPGITELLFDLGQGERLVGRTDFCIHPPQAEKIKSMGGISDASLEMIVASQPDIVFTASMVSKQMVERMEDLGLNVVCLPERSKISDVYETVGLLGRIFGKEQLCDSLIGGMQQSIAEIEKQNAIDSMSKIFSESSCMLRKNYLYSAMMPSMSAVVNLPYTLPLTVRTGARPQAPMQRVASSENLPSEDVPPPSRPSTSPSLLYRSPEPLT